MGRQKNYDTKAGIINRIRFLQKRTVPTTKFYNQFTVEILREIRKMAQIDFDLWKFELDRIKKKPRAMKK